MVAAYEKGLILYRQHRYAAAAEQFRDALSAMPQWAMAHSMLALCLLYDKQQASAIAEARKAIELNPELSFAHYAMAHVLMPRRQALSSFRFVRRRDRSFRRSLKQARLATMEALRLETQNADIWALSSWIEALSRNWKASLTAAERGLAIHPLHNGCANFRAQALHLLGRLDDASVQTMDSLTKDPENETTHRNRGWLELAQGNHRAAEEHFCQALRIEPGSANAKKGLKLAQRSRFFAYRWWLQNRLWMEQASHNFWMFAAVTIGIVGILAANIFFAVKLDAQPTYSVLLIFVEFHVFLAVLRIVSTKMQALRQRRRLKEITFTAQAPSQY